jgi:hypothetical protein
MDYRAARTTRVDLATDQVILDGQTFIVFGIIVANRSSDNVEVEFQTGTGAVKFTITASCKSSIVDPIEFIADRGLKIDGFTGGGDVIVSIFHSQVT